MALITADRVKETTTVVGTGTITLLGAQTGFQSFAIVGTGNTCYYAIASIDGTYWETGIGTYTLSGTTLARTTVLTSSNANALVSFIAGIKEVFVTYPASKSVFLDSAGTMVTAGVSPYPAIRPSLNLDFANSKQLDPRITFSRGTTGTYYDGKMTTKAEENLILNSNTPAITLRRTTAPTNNEIAPDGTATAYHVIDTISTSATIGVDIGISLSVGVPYTVSIFVKRGILATAPTNILIGGISNGFGSLLTNKGANVNLVTGAVNATETNVIATPGVSFGNGWFRFNITFTPTTSGTFNSGIVYFTNDTTKTSTPAYIGNGTSDVYIWGAQLEQRSQATAYTPTTTVPITNYIPQLMTAPAGVARFDHEPLTGKSLGLLIEEGRTNLLNYSQTFSLTQATTEQYWVDTSITRTLSVFIGADGIQSGVQITATAANAKTVVSVVQSTSADRTLSVFLKRITGIGVINYTLDNGATWIAQAITSTLTRYYFPATTSAQQVGFQIVTSGDSIGIWGAQLEAGALATSYIPTTTAAVTRVADQASMTGANFSSWYRQSEGSFLFEGNTIYVPPTPTPALTPSEFMVADAVGLNGISANIVNSTSNSLRALITGSTNYSAVLESPTTVANVTYKDAVTYTATNLSAYRNGISSVSTSLTSPIAFINNLTIGSSLNGRYLNGRIKKLSYYPKALSSTELQGLTS